MIGRGGELAAGRPETAIGAHVADRNNGTIGVCLIGGHGLSERNRFADNFTPAQERTLRTLVAEIARRTAIDPSPDTTSTPRRPARASTCRADRRDSDDHHRLARGGGPRPLGHRDRGAPPPGTALGPMTGVRHALSRGLQERDTVAEAAVDYVRTSVPDALRALRPGPQQLVEMAEAKLEGLPRQ